ASTQYNSPFSSLINVLEAPSSSNSTFTTSCSKDISTPFFTSSLAKTVSKSARGACHVQSQPSVCFILKSKWQTTSSRMKRSPGFFSKPYSFNAENNPTSSKSSIHRGNKLSPISNLGNFDFSTTLMFLP